MWRKKIRGKWYVSTNLEAWKLRNLLNQKRDFTPQQLARMAQKMFDKFLVPRIEQVAKKKHAGELRRGWRDHGDFDLSVTELEIEFISDFGGLRGCEENTVVKHLIALLERRGYQVWEHEPMPALFLDYWGLEIGVCPSGSKCGCA